MATRQARRDGVDMFSIDCPTHGRRVLLGPDRIVGVRNHHDGGGRHGISLDWRCWCGHRGTLRTGAAP